jgi:hypothetical protein
MTTKTMNDQELRLSGIVALNKALGVHGAFRFLTLLHWDPTDYVQVSRRLYKGQTVDEIFNRAKRTWRKAG